MKKLMQRPALMTTLCQPTEAEVAVETKFPSPSAITYYTFLRVEKHNFQLTWISSFLPECKHENYPNLNLD